MVSIEEERRLELELRTQLGSVELVCEADISTEQLARAAQVISRLIHFDPFNLLNRLPATLVTYFVLRGAEVYDRNEIWPGLGVARIHQKKAREAFLLALKRLGLPDFQDQVKLANAKRFVTPILVHGALPANVARRLVDCVKAELRRGLVDADEARRMLLDRSDVTQQLGVPAQRLLEWCPQYATDLLEAVIEYVEQPGGDAPGRLPLHLRDALHRQVDRSEVLQRIRVPRVEFAFWSGVGPEVLGVENSTWTLEVGSERNLLKGGIRVGLRPNSSARVVGEGRTLPLWPIEQAWFFDRSDRPVSTEVPLPVNCVALLPMGWELWSDEGNRVPEVVEGALLTGDWTHYRSCVTSLLGHRQISVGPRDDPRRVVRTVAASATTLLVGPTCPDALTFDRAPVYTEAPKIRVPAKPDHAVKICFRPRRGRPVIRDLNRQSADGLLSLAELLPEGRVDGELEIFESAARVRLSIVPGLTVERPLHLLRPADSANVRAMFLGSDGEIAITETFVPEHASETTITGLGEGPNAIVVPLPRVRWALRTSQLSRVQFADDKIWRSADELCSGPAWLYVRIGVPAEVGVVLRCGDLEQVVEARPTMEAGPAAHHCTIPLEQLQDTIRGHLSEHLEIALVIDSQEIVVVESGDPVVRPVDLRDEGEAEFDAEQARLLLGELRSQDRGYAIAAFLSAVGRRHRNWRFIDGEHLSGNAFDEWERLDWIADQLWSLTGIRNGLFSGVVLERVGQWSTSRRERCRTVAETERRRIQEWLVIAHPQRSLLKRWANGHLVGSVLPGRDDVTSEWLPGSILFHALCLVGGDEYSGDAIREADELDASLTREVVALVLQVILKGNRIVPLPDWSDSHSVDQRARQTEEYVGPSMLQSLNGCSIDVVAHQVVISPLQTSALSMVRFIDGTRAVGIVLAKPVEDRLVLEPPADLSGELGIEVVDPRCVPTRCRAEHTVMLSAPADHDRARPQRFRTFHDLDAARHHATACRISEVALTGRYPRSYVNELFEDQKGATNALLNMTARGATPLERSLALVACLPKAFDVFDLKTDPDRLRDDRLAFAVLGPRDAADWTAIGWPNARRYKSGNDVSELAGFVRRLQINTETISAPTFRYEQSTERDWPNYDSPDLINSLVDRLDKDGADPAFVDLVVAVHRAVSFDHLVDEAMQMVFNIHRSSPRRVAAAVVGGVLLALAGND